MFADGLVCAVPFTRDKRVSLYQLRALIGGVHVVWLIGVDHIVELIGSG